MKKKFIFIALFAVNISWAEGVLRLRQYKNIGGEFIQRVIETHSNINPKYILAYGKQTQKLINNGKAYACVAYKNDKFIAQAVLVPQIKNKHFRQEFVGLAPGAIKDENSIHEFTNLLQSEFINAEGLACCFPKYQLKEFEKLLDMTGYKPNPEIAEHPYIMKEYYGDIFTTADHLWYSLDFEEIRKN
jgi:hypothetical protein